MPTKYTKELLEEAVKKSETMADVARYFGIKPHGGGMHHLKTRCEHYGISISHFKGQSWSKGLIFDNRRKRAEEILIKRGEGNRAKTYQLKRALLESNVAHECSECGLKNEWNGKKINLEIDHINGEFLDDRKENLRFLCPNCHSQTTNYKNKK